MIFKNINLTRKLRLAAFRLFVFLLVAPGMAHGLTRKSPEQAAAMVLQHAIQLYIKSEERLPTSWDDLRKSEGSGFNVKHIENTIKDFTTNYRFVKSDIKITFQGIQYSVIAMGVTTRKPGPRGSLDRKVRSVILMTATNQIQHLTLTEEQLENTFRDAGLDLLNFTGAGGQWAVESSDAGFQPHQGESISRDKIDRNNAEDISRGKQLLSDKGNVAAESGPRPKNGVMAWTIGSVLAVFLAVGWYLFKRRNKP